MHALRVDNVQDGEEVYQRCLLLTGRCTGAPDDSHVHITTLSDADKPLFPAQQWPMHQGHFKALLLLAPGNNKITLRSGHSAAHTLTLTLRYIPLLQAPPLHLAVLIARDSPLLIDCPPSKFAALSTAHCSLPSAIAKFRTTALMWQALTAEDFRLNGLSRRAFRLEEEFTTSTLSRAYANSPRPPQESIPKIHLVRTEHTVSELRDVQRAQQNPHATKRDSLHDIFTKALKAHGAPFDTQNPVFVAGLILDSHYAAEQDLILAHAALGAHNPAGLSLGIFGSHLTYAWPRFLEEVSECLVDGTPPGCTVANDNGECGTAWEACAVGQGAFLHEVGHAFGAPHTTGIMQRGYSPDWARWFVVKGGYCSSKGEQGGLVKAPGVEGEESKCRWDVRDLLRFRALDAFMLPGDKEVDGKDPVVEMEDVEGGDLAVKMSCEAGIAVVMFNGAVEPVASVRKPAHEISFGLTELEARFDAKKPLELLVVGMNGKERKLDVWKFLNSRSWVRVPGTNIRLLKKSVGDNQTDEWQWAVMLKKRGKNGNLIDASKIDIRVGCGFDGAEVYYRDGTKIPCGRRGRTPDEDPHMGGHQAKKIAIRKGVEVTKVAVNGGSSWGLAGMRVWLSDGSARGALNKRSNSNGVKVMKPDEGYRIIGFFGASGQYGMCHKFGIITAPKNVELPDSVYDLDELQNKCTGERSSKRRKISRDEQSETEDDEDSISEDEDEGYDNDSDVDDDDL
ncbi:putative peptidase family-domain-containing protein [Cercophora newfieldiana]|uniref:Peptidase family-domain-containing protein n=1 Tax=Cercophora newfieldiana TaxID=92897 RepID=A0AA39XUN9_9PEZI|nr:putative peptidase family-domain-containing protein [Cercophora newfieldiana]